MLDPGNSLNFRTCKSLFLLYDHKINSVLEKDNIRYNNKIGSNASISIAINIPMVTIDVLKENKKDKYYNKTVKKSGSSCFSDGNSDRKSGREF